MLQLLPANTARWIGCRMDAAEPRFHWEAPRCGTTTPWAALPTAAGAHSACENLELEIFGTGLLSASSMLSSPGDTSQAAWPRSGQHQAGQIKHTGKDDNSTTERLHQGQPRADASADPRHRTLYLQARLSVQEHVHARSNSGMTLTTPTYLHTRLANTGTLFPSSWLPGAPAGGVPWLSIDILALVALITSDSSVVGTV